MSDYNILGNQTSITPEGYDYIKRMSELRPSEINREYKRIMSRKRTTRSLQKFLTEKIVECTKQIEVFNNIRVTVCNLPTAGNLPIRRRDEKGNHYITFFNESRRSLELMIQQGTNNITVIKKHLIDYTVHQLIPKYPELKSWLTDVQLERGMEVSFPAIPVVATDALTEIFKAFKTFGYKGEEDEFRNVLKTEKGTLRFQSSVRQYEIGLCFQHLQQHQFVLNYDDIHILIGDEKKTWRGIQKSTQKYQQPDSKMHSLFVKKIVSILQVT